MLATQVSYWTLQEAKRHNLATEDLGNRTLTETVRHNVVTENETQRHNVAQEDYWTNSLNETVRHNLATEGIGVAELGISQFRAETDRMNAFTNQRNAASNEMNAATNSRNASTNEYNAQTSRFGTWANYNLGLDANRISQENADLRDRELKQRFLEYTTGEKNSGVQQRNASTNALNAETNARQADVAEGNLNLSQEKYQWQQFTDTVDLGIKAAKVVNDTLNNVLQHLPQ